MTGRVLFNIAFLLLFQLTSAGAEDWKLVTRDSDRGISLYADPGSVEVISGNILRAWVRYQYQEHFQGRREYDCKKCTPEKLLSYTIAQKEFDCGEKRTRFLRITEYYTDQTIKAEVIEDTWKKVRPGEAETSLIHYICEQRQ